MGAYHHVSRDERAQIEVLWRPGVSIREVARRLGRAPSTISRELRRNGERGAPYAAPGAERLRRQRARGRPPRRIVAPEGLAQQGNAAFTWMAQGLQAGWTPQQISGRLALLRPGWTLSHETIYRYIYATAGGSRLAPTGVDEWWTYLPQKRRARRAQSRLARAKRRERGVSIEQRNASVLRRLEPGDWEGDLLGFANPRGALLVLVERRSRFRLALLLPDKTAASVAAALKRAILALPRVPWRSITLDNGAEFARWRAVSEATGVPFYFCHPYAAWEKGTVESLHRFLRRYLPRHTNLNTLKQAELTDICEELNDRPMKCLGYRTPREVLHSELGLRVALHL